MAKKYWLYTHDPILTLCYPPAQAEEMFGKEGVEEDGVEVPEELANQVIETYEKLIGLSRQLAEIRKAKERL